MMSGESLFENTSQPVIRRLWWYERGLLGDHLLHLDADDRYMRFGAHVGDDYVRRYADANDWFQRSVLGGFVDGELRAAAEFRLLDIEWPRRAELAFSVERPFQGQGLGTELFRRMVIFARNRQVRRAYIVTLASNRRIRRIAAKFGMTLKPSEGDLEGRLELVWPNYLSIMDEAWDEGQALLRERLQRAAGPTRTHQASETRDDGQ